MRPSSRRLASAGLLAALAALAALSATPSATPAGAQTTRARPAPADTGRFEGEIRAFEAADRISRPAAGSVLFYGSSSIRMWCTLDRDFPGLAVVNRGFGGSEMSDAVRYASRVVLPLRPATIVLYEGDNDLEAGRTPEQVRDGFRRFAAAVRGRLPATRLVVLSIKPSTARLALLPRMREANALLRAEVARDSLATFVDVFTPMLGADGRPRSDLFGPDSLHMNSTGYALWRSVLGPVLEARAR